DFPFDLGHEKVAVIGQGNVAIDIARILCCSRKELAHTDISQHALEVLSASQVKEVHVYGRRSAFHASFTPSEIKEMTKLVDCSLHVDPLGLNLDPVEQKELDIQDNVFRKKNLDILKSFVHENQSGPITGNYHKRFVLHFNRTPQADNQ
ncbi:MAG: NADP oxidoreductase, partial [Candidatus Omnitrophica bacterium]|nr:NADP oxidoreductase [Candidatus Omnitrophota bacterium]